LVKHNSFNIGMPGFFYSRHIFFAFFVKKLANYLEIPLFMLYLCDIKMISILTLKTLMV